MGRGPGNLKTEDILMYLNDYKKTKNFTKLKSYFESLKKYINGDQINIIDLLL